MDGVLANINSSVVQKTKDFWQKKTLSTITDECGRGIFKNLSGFFDALLRLEGIQMLVGDVWDIDSNIWVYIGALKIKPPILSFEDVLIVANGNRKEA